MNSENLRHKIVWHIAGAAIEIETDGDGNVFVNGDKVAKVGKGNVPPLVGLPLNMNNETKGE